MSVSSDDLCQASSVVLHFVVRLPLLVDAGGVAAFNRETDVDRLDYRLMIHSPVRLLHRRDFVDAAAEWLRRHGYQVVVVDASWLTPLHMFRDVGSALGYTCHDQWHCLGEGLSQAITDCWDGSTGFVLVLTSFDVFVHQHRDDAHTLLELVAERAWSAALLGRRVLCLVQSDNPSIRLRRIGMWTMAWSDHELSQFQSAP